MDHNIAHHIEEASMAGFDVDIVILMELFEHLRELKRMEEAFAVLARAGQWDAIAGVIARRAQVIEQICDWLTLHDIDWLTLHDIWGPIE
jgi:hypothetical protein